MELWHIYSLNELHLTIKINAKEANYLCKRSTFCMNKTKNSQWNFEFLLLYPNIKSYKRYTYIYFLGN